ncbi:hypothetical protein NNJEOMEG_02092 [Fundidesulfovibrio magnetotacticus]|uniref:Glycosyltransferase n=1 Tax=Fundidesulfovibrio magnetotacticus TaxID=2730080 RepID=A0A6V8LTI6_9BACT|nr:hypothetical protein [Fundidesulfovibrio magnetotacticus]GFK94250.1 hypothetical protein NNJEOMEG_02092 [Fundidesulfovibrio magnetotacticus]
MAKIDVAINVLGKPYQTTLTLVSLLRHSWKHIDRIYLAEEAANSPGQSEGLSYVKEKLRAKLTVFNPRYCHWIRSVDPEKLADDDVRLAVRYQYAWEHSDKDRLLVIHNDCHFRGDVVGAMLEAMGDAVAIGDVGACMGCPAHYAGKCGKGRHLDYRPGLEELTALYAAHDYSGPHHVSPMHESLFNEKFRSHPWPLPPCRVNEWCALVDLKAARPLTMPLGSGSPLGAITAMGEYALDTGAEWFHDMHVLGLRAAHFPVEEYLLHGCGHHSMLDPGVYRANEEKARTLLRREYNIDF